MGSPGIGKVTLEVRVLRIPVAVSPELADRPIIYEPEITVRDAGVRQGR